MREKSGIVCRLPDIGSKSTLLQIVRQSDPKKMMALVERLVSGGNGVKRQDLRKETAKVNAGRPKPFLFSFRPETKHFQLRMTFRKGKVEKAEIIAALENIIKELRTAR